MDRREYFRSLGYQVRAGALEFYYVSVRTDTMSHAVEICLCGGISWASDLHDPGVTLQKMKGAESYTYSRLGPYPSRKLAEQAAMDMAMKVHNDPTRYGMASVSGPREMPSGFTREPSFF